LQVFTSLYNTDDSCFVCAPTGSGKTICAEFALLRLLAREQQARAGGEGGGTSLKDGKPLVHAVYVAPLEPLVTERYGDWQEKLVKGLGMKIARLTGGSWMWPWWWSPSLSRCCMEIVQPAVLLF
jgi:pre-mRNA-splicing helicase BRR2